MTNKKEHVALTSCFFCGEGNEILLAKNYYHNGEPVHDLSGFHGKVINMNPCSKCAGYMKQGIVVIVIDVSKSDRDWDKSDGSDYWMPNPYRTGVFTVITDNAMERLLENKPELLAWAKKHRWMFMDVEAADQSGLSAQIEADLQKRRAVENAA